MSIILVLIISLCIAMTSLWYAYEWRDDAMLFFSHHQSLSDKAAFVSTVSRPSGHYAAGSTGTKRQLLRLSGSSFTFTINPGWFDRIVRNSGQWVGTWSGSGFIAIRLIDHGDYHAGYEAGSSGSSISGILPLMPYQLYQRQQTQSFDKHCRLFVNPPRTLDTQVCAEFPSHRLDYARIVYLFRSYQAFFSPKESINENDGSFPLYDITSCLSGSDLGNHGCRTNRQPFSGRTYFF